MRESVHTVSSLVYYLKEKIKQDINLQGILIKGEISNFTNHKSGHWYFTLKDKKSRISCIMFSSYARSCNYVLKEGVQVIVEASLSVYEPQGSCQLYVTNIKMDGLGDLYLKLEHLKTKLLSEGLFDQRFKKKIPRFPNKIVLVTGKDSAALQDMKITLKNRWPIAEIHIIPSLVQGMEASTEIIKNLQKADQLGADTIILARGGGSIEDLWCFNDENLARVIFQLKTPIITGVGHESDTTLVDYVSDYRAATPTAAIQIATPEKNEILRQNENLRKYLWKLIHMHVQKNQQQLKYIQRYRFFQDPINYITEDRIDLALHMKHLEINVRNFYNEKKASFQTKQLMSSNYLKYIQIQKQQATQRKQKLIQAFHDYVKYNQLQLYRYIDMLEALSPTHILKRGYHLLYEEDRLIKSIRDIRNNNIKVFLYDGIIHAKIERKEDIGEE